MLDQENGSVRAADFAVIRRPHGTARTKGMRPFHFSRIPFSSFKKRPSEGRLPSGGRFDASIFYACTVLQTSGAFAV